ncbi:MAG: HlyD family efflux transporter periplasmic adaptor subunit [Gemmataceae bacterium]|nr:HlyD family efflux transporter periplasmic adaptor subunit [Gemmataceae bacterium]
MKNKFVILALVVILVAAGGGAVYWFSHDNHGLRFPGIVEIQEVRLGSKVGGRVEAVLVKEGDVLEKDTYHRQPLVVFEAPELRNQKQQALARLQAAEADWDRAKNGPRWEEINAAFAGFTSAQAKYDRVLNGWRIEEQQQAKSDLDTSEADYEQALREWNRVAGLYRLQNASRLEYDTALGARDRALGRMNSSRARFKMVVQEGSRQEDKDEARADRDRAYANYLQLQNGTRKEDKDLAKAKVDELRANLVAIEISLAETTVSVPANLGKAVVEVVAVRPGDLVAPNQPIVRVLRVEDLWVKIFVPETQYGLVTLKKEVNVTIDSHPGKVFKGIVVQRSNISEFTPRNVQSVDERRHQVFGVKILVKDPSGVLNAGMAAEVTIPLD